MTAAPRPPVPPVTIAVRRQVSSLVATTAISMFIQPTPSAPAPTVSHMFVRDSKTAQEIDQVLLVRGVETGSGGRRHDPARSSLGDRSGQVVAIAGTDVEALLARCAPVRRCASRGRYERHPRYGRAGRRPRAERAGCPARSTSPTWSTARRARPSQMEADLRELVAHGPGPAPPRAARAHLRRGHARAGAATAARPRPSTTTRPTATACSSTRLRSRRPSARSARTFPGIDHDVAVTGALLHDIGKLEAYTRRRRRDRPHRRRPPAGRDPARLLPHPPRDRGPRRASRPTPPQAVLHIILSHHGSLAHGSPVVPCTREATLVHMIDNLGGRLGSFDRLEKELAPGQSWTSYDRGDRLERVLRPRGRGRAPGGVAHPPGGVSIAVAQPGLPGMPVAQTNVFAPERRGSRKSTPPSSHTPPRRPGRPCGTHFGPGRSQREERVS